MTAAEKIHYWMLKNEIRNGTPPKPKEISVQLEIAIEEETNNIENYNRKTVKKLTNLYVVVKDEDLLFNDYVYDFQTAESVCTIAKNQGYANAEVITLAYAMRNMYSI